MNWLFSPIKHKPHGKHRDPTKVTEALQRPKIETSGTAEITNSLDGKDSGMRQTELEGGRLVLSSLTSISFFPLVV